MEKMSGKKRLIIGLVSIFVLAVLVLFCCGDLTITKIDETSKDTEESIDESVDVLDEASLELFDTGKGLTIKMGSGMKENKNGDHSVYYFADNVMVSVKMVGFEELEEDGTGSADSSIEDYIKIIEDNNENIAFTTDSYGNPSTTYTVEDKKNDLFYYATVRKGSEAFWLINFSCLEEEKDARLPEFELWASTIEVN
ncbi:hypothetical protein [Frisingicoccus sp.]|uniref:hypothetical protein n=1 Tax=Frisingicoccus sp. TaxID=1918627 RepID=UPI00386963D9